MKRLMKENESVTATLWNIMTHGRSLYFIFSKICMSSE